MLDVILTVLFIVTGTGFAGYVTVTEAKIHIAEKNAPAQIQAAVQAGLFEVLQQKKELDAKSHLTTDDVTWLRSRGWEPDPKYLPKELQAPARPRQRDDVTEFMTRSQAERHEYYDMIRANARNIGRVRKTSTHNPTFIRSEDGREIYILEEDM